MDIAKNRWNVNACLDSLEFYVKHVGISASNDSNPWCPNVSNYANLAMYIVFKAFRIQ